MAGRGSIPDILRRYPNSESHFQPLLPHAQAQADHHRDLGLGLGVHRLSSQGEYVVVVGNAAGVRMGESCICDDEADLPLHM